ncbi:META domain-containing protein [Streptomyces sp. NPDC002073]
MPAALVAALAMTACGTDSGTATGSAPEGEALTGIKWNVESVTVDGKTTAAPAGADLVIEGKEASGNYGCNRFTADVTADGATLTFKPGATTTMACDDMAFETLYAGVLKGALKADASADKLTLTGADGDRINLTSKAVAPPKAASFTGTKWSVDALAGGSSPLDSVSSVPEGKSYFTVGKDGSVRGNLGCNSFNTTAKIAGDTVTFGPIASTRMACTGPEGDAEKAMTELLGSGALKVTIEGNALTLTADSGKSLGAKALRK